MKVQVIAVVDVDDDSIEKPANMTEEKHREITAKAVAECVLTAVSLNRFGDSDWINVDFVTAAPVLDKNDPFFAT
jgi:hypothetical protein